MKHALTALLLAGLALLAGACASSTQPSYPTSEVLAVDTLPPEVRTALADAQAAGQPLLVDFHAVW